MRYFIDTEFWDRPGRLHLISLGIVAEDGREFYAENADFVWGEVPAEHWIQANIKPLLSGGDVLMPYHEIGPAVLNFIGDDKHPEFWAYFASYDWVAFCWLFGSMVQSPKHFPMFCLDIQQWRYMLNPALRLPKHEGTVHNALDDARWTKQAWEYLKRLTNG